MVEKACCGGVAGGRGVGDSDTVDVDWACGDCEGNSILSARGETLLGFGGETETEVLVEGPGGLLAGFGTVPDGLGVSC